MVLWIFLIDWTNRNEALALCNCTKVKGKVVCALIEHHARRTIIFKCFHGFVSFISNCNTILCVYGVYSGHCFM